MIFQRSKLFTCLASWRDEKEVRKKLCLGQSRQERQVEGVPSRSQMADLKMLEINSHISLCKNLRQTVTQWGGDGETSQGYY